MRFLSHVFLLLVMFTVPAYAQADKQDRLLDIQEVVSDSGIKAWLVEDSSIPVLAMQFSFKGAGAVNETPQKQGLARMLSNTLDEGAGDIDSQSFQKELQDLSISLSFSASRDNFGGNVKTLSKNRARAFELLALALTKPRFDPEPVERMKIANQSRIRSSLSRPDWIAARLLNDIAFAGHPYALNSGGTLSSLDAITPDDLRAFHKAYIGKNNLVVSVAGDIDAETLKVKLDDIFGDLPDVTIPDAPPLTLQNQNTVTVFEKDIPQTIVQMSKPGIDRHDPDYQAAQVMNFVLGSSGFGSRLTEEIREKRGLTYGVYSSFYNLDELAVMNVSTSTKNENVPQMIDSIKAEFNKMHETGITQDELDDAKAYLIGSLPLSLTSTDKIAGLMLSLLENDDPINYLDIREKAIENMTLEDITRVSKRLLSSDEFVTVLVGKPPEGDLGDITRVETLPNAE